MASAFRNPWGAWVVAHTMRPPVVESGAASVARPSIGTPQRRWLTMRWRTTLKALAKAASASPAVMRFSCSTLPGASAWIWGAPDFRASSGSLTAGSGSQSTTTSAAASTAWASVAAMTAATVSPT